MTPSKIFKVRVRTTNALGGSTKVDNEKYVSCSHGVVYIITSNPEKIYEKLPLTISIEEIGIGYTI